MSYTLNGTVKKIGEVQNITDKFRKREIVITDNSGKYAQHITMQLANDKCSLADSLYIGDEIEVSFNLNGREYSKDGEVKYFNSIEIWKLNVLVGASTNGGITVSKTDEEESDLPF